MTIISKKKIPFNYVFTTFVPNILQEGHLYISLEYNTAVHKCACGCGEEVVTPLSPTEWKLTYNGQSVSLHPSIGNWSYQCRSHYWIRENAVVWAESWSDEQVKKSRSMQQRPYVEQDYSVRSAPTSQKESKGLVQSFISTIKKIFK